MHEPPRDVSDAEVLARVQTHWDPSMSGLAHLPVGFGAWHWRADSSPPHGSPSALFVTLDPPLWHSAESLETTYAAAAALATELGFVHPPLPGASGRFTVPLGPGWLSVTGWVDGARPTDPAAVVPLIEQLHRMDPPAGVRSWETSVAADLVDRLAKMTAQPWLQGPHGEAARCAVRSALPLLATAVDEHQQLSARLDPSRFVLTHGEPGVHNQWRTADGRLVLIDWETLRLAPPERDLTSLPSEVLPSDPESMRLMRLEWSLSEVAAYADWLRGPHQDDADTRVALGGLVQEIEAATASPPPR